MATLTWDAVGERLYQTGVDRGVLYLHDGTVVPWNGLIAVEESSNSELKSFYLEGVKYLENLSPGDFLGKLRAYTYPDEFDLVNGITKLTSGLSFYEQVPTSFNLSYRTKIGNDVDGTDFGYKIHIFYNLIANPENYAFDTFKESTVQPIEFSWSLTGTPAKIPGYRPTVHVSIDSTKTDPLIIKALEDKLYGTPTSNPIFLSIIDIAEFFGYLGALIIIDNGDGTWVAIDSLDTYITMIDESTFEIDNADVTYLDPDTYEISSTNI